MAGDEAAIRETEEHLNDYIHLLEKLTTLERKRLFALNQFDRKFAYRRFLYKDVRTIINLYDALVSDNTGYAIVANDKKINPIRNALSVFTERLNEVRDLLEDESKVESDSSEIKASETVVIKQFEMEVSTLQKLLALLRESQRRPDDESSLHIQGEIDDLSDLWKLLREKHGVRYVTVHIAELFSEHARKIGREKRHINIMFELCQKGITLCDQVKGNLVLTRSSTHVFTRMMDEINIFIDLLNSEKKHIIDPLHEYLKHLSELTQRMNLNPTPPSYEPAKIRKEYIWNVFHVRADRITSKMIYEKALGFSNWGEAQTFFAEILHHDSFLDDRAFLRMKGYKRGQDPSRTNINILSSFKKQIKMHKLKQEIKERQSGKDKLTGLDKMSEKELLEYIQEKLTPINAEIPVLSICQFDLDDFKGYNEIYGQKGGNTVLSKLGTWLTLTFRTSDMRRIPDKLLRVGGEEFMVIMPDTPMSSTSSFPAVKAMMRFRKELRKNSEDLMRKQNELLFGKDKDEFCSRIARTYSIQADLVMKIVNYFYRIVRRKAPHLETEGCKPQVKANPLQLKMVKKIGSYLQQGRFTDFYKNKKLDNDTRQKILVEIANYCLRKRRITFSGGIATLPEDKKKTAEALMDLADYNQRMAKKNGGDCIYWRGHVWRDKMER